MVDEQNKLLGGISESNIEFSKLRDQSVDNKAADLSKEREEEIKK